VQIHGPINWLGADAVLGTASVCRCSKADTYAVSLIECRIDERVARCESIQMFPVLTFSAEVVQGCIVQTDPTSDGCISLEHYFVYVQPSRTAAP
jgi:hypothetical protein